MAGPVTAYNVLQSGGAQTVGPSRSRIRAITIFGSAAGALTITDGNGGATLVTQKFPAGFNGVYIPDDGILATNGVYVSAISGASNELTVFLS